MSGMMSPLLEQRLIGAKLAPIVVSLQADKFQTAASQVFAATPRGRRAGAQFFGLPPPPPPPPLPPPPPFLIPPPPPFLPPLLPPLPFLPLTMAGISMVSTLATPEEAERVVGIDGVRRVYLDLPQGTMQPNIARPTGKQIVPGETWFGADAVFQAMQVDQARKAGMDGRGVKVAVLDTGAELFHPQLQMGIQIDGAPHFGPPIDENGHGSWCVTAVRGAKRESSGLIAEGVAPACQLLSVKVLGAGIGAGSTGTILWGMERALRWGAQVVSMSLGGEGVSDIDSPYTEVISTTKDKVCWVVAAGNSGPAGSTTNTPGSIKDAITVGSFSLTDGGVSAFSSRGPTKDNNAKPDLIAPGGGRAIPKAKPGEKVFSGVPALSLFGQSPVVGYTGMQGTSMATPRVAGLLALVLQAKPRGSGEDITARIKRLATAAGGPPKNDSGSGPARWSMFVP